ILSLTAWAQQHISSILQATTATAFNASFDSFLDPNATVMLNGEYISREAYKEWLQRDLLFRSGAEVHFTDALEVSLNETRPVQAGVIGLFYNVIIYERLISDGVPLHSQVNSSIN
ncbi:hypothetical protein B0H10DRAFT_1647964, partial [Mycena sp. CBHHK59/15]